MQREPEESEVVNNGQDLSEAETDVDAAAAAAADEPEAEAITKTPNKKKNKTTATSAKKRKPTTPDAKSRRDTRAAASSSSSNGEWVGEAPRGTKRHLSLPEALSTDQVLHKALSDGTIQDMFLRSGIATKTTTAAEKTRRIFLSVTKTLLEATLAHTASRRCRTATLEDVRHGHKSQVGRALYTHTPTCKADYVNRRPAREKTLRLRRKHARELKQTMTKPLAEAAATTEKN